MEQMQYNLMFRWFVGLSLHKAATDAPARRGRSPKPSRSGLHERAVKARGHTYRAHDR